MSLTPSKMLPLGTLAPVFSLKNVSDRVTISPKTYCKGHAFVIAFICNHCPYVIHILNGFVRVASIYQKKGVEFIAISSNNISKFPEDSPELMKELSTNYNFTFPYCYDSTQEVAKNYQAACTPDFYFFDQEHKLVYRGQFDDSRPKNGVEVTGKDLTTAIDLLLTGQAPLKNQKPSLGCNIKWK